MVASILPLSVREIDRIADRYDLRDRFGCILGSRLAALLSSWEVNGNHQKEDGVESRPYWTRKRGYWITNDVRRRVLSAGKCAHCGATENLQVDHIIPWSKGGTDHITNLQPLCKGCNCKKSNRFTG
jgi:5-methylcytosine-specific restriction endonuclease McrA